ncbi:MAG: PAS domain-containing protein [Pseudomonadota bacterium]
MLDRTAHPNTRTMLEAWRRMDTAPGVLAQAGLDSDDPSGLVNNIFVLRGAESDNWIFRTSGQSLNRFLGKQMCDENFLDLWLGADRGMVQSVITSVLAEKGPGLIRARGETLIGRQLDVEIALAPLPASQGSVSRILGHYQPLGGEAMLGERPIWRHSVTELRTPQRPMRRSHLTLVSSRD